MISAIAIRGFVGQTGFTGLQSDASAIIGFGVAACIGKMAGGSIADRFRRQSFKGKVTNLKMRTRDHRTIFSGDT
jgi:hypothetical protein